MNALKQVLCMGCQKTEILNETVMKGKSQ